LAALRLLTTQATIHGTTPNNVKAHPIAHAVLHAAQVTEPELAPTIIIKNIKITNKLCIFILEIIHKI